VHKQFLALQLQLLLKKVTSLWQHHLPSQAVFPELFKSTTSISSNFVISEFNLRAIMYKSGSVEVLTMEPISYDGYNWNFMINL
jgi:hypothetical protein